jgi:hypothetical protein
MFAPSVFPSTLFSSSILLSPPVFADLPTILTPVAGCFLGTGRLAKKNMYVDRLLKTEREKVIGVRQLHAGKSKNQLW